MMDSFNVLLLGCFRDWISFNNVLVYYKSEKADFFNLDFLFSFIT